MGEALTPKYQVLADAVLAGKSAIDAAIIAGYSPQSARTTGRRVLQNTAVQSYIASKQQIISAKTDDLSDRVRQELEAMAFANIEDLTRLGSDGQRTVDFSNATRAQLASVNKITNKRRKVYNAKGEHIATEEQDSFTLADKYRGLELLGRHIGMFKEAEQRVVIDVADRLLQARQRMLRITDVTDRDAEQTED